MFTPVWSTPRRQVPELGQGGLDTGPLLPPVTLYDLQGLVWKAALRETLWAHPDAEKLLQQGRCGE